MERLSFPLEFFVCSASKKREPNPVCLIMGGIVELLNLGYINRTEKDKLVPAKPLDDVLPYLKPLYDKITEAKKPHTAKQVVESFNGKQTQKLISAYKAVLLESGYADEVPNSRHKKKNAIVPITALVKETIARVRAEMLSDAEISGEVILLVTLLDASGQVGDYFSKFEKNDFKKRIKEVQKNESGALIREVLSQLSDDTVMASIAAIPV